MSHARPHLETHSRAKGHSAVAGVAYRLGLRLYDRRTGIWHDYTKRALGEEIVRALTIAPEGAPPWASDPQELFSRSEEASRRRDSQVARDYRVPIPLGLSDRAAGDMAEAMARFIVQELGTSVSMGLHRDADVDALGKVKPPEKQGFHAHLYFPTRRIDCSGKSESEGGTGMGELLSALSNKRTSAPIVERFNARWAALANEYTAAAGIVADYDHRSYQRMGLAVVPQPTLGAPAVAMERSGFFTRKGDAVREIVVMSEVYKQAHAAALEAQHAQAVVDRANAMPMPPAAASSEPSVVSTPTSNEEPSASPVGISLDSGSVLSRFRASIGELDSNTAGKHAEAISLVRLIQATLRVLERLAEGLRRFAKDQERERAAALEVEGELVGRRAQRAEAHQKLKQWEAAHPWRMAAAKAKGGDAPYMPEAWRRLHAHVRLHHGDVQALKAAARGHRGTLAVLDEQRAPIQMQHEIQEGRLRGLLKALSELGEGYAAQLMAVCRPAERMEVQRLLPDEATSAENEPSASALLPRPIAGAPVRRFS